MTTFTVEQDWHDRGGTERPKIEDVTFNILQNVPNGTASTYISDKGELLNSHVNDKLYYYTINATNLNGSDYEYKVYRETEKKDSSTYLYYYTVPEYAENEKAYVYSSQPTYQFNSEEYKDEPTNESNKYLAVGLTEFEFTMNWIDAYDSSARPTINAQYIKDHFDLYNKNTNTIVNFLPDDVNAEDYITITDDGNTTSVKIKRLEDIHFNQATNEYYANEYYLKLKDNITNTPLTLPVETPTLASTNDYYAIQKFDNDSQAYINEIQNVLLDFTNDWTKNDIPVPKYDDRGRELAYRAVEVRKEYPPTMEFDGIEKNVSFYSTYAWDVTYEGTGDVITNYNYVVTNHRTIDGNDHNEIAINKEWVDDGELEYRQPIQIIAENVGSHIVTTTGENGETTTAIVPYETQTQPLNKENVWEGRFDVSQYQKDENGNDVTDENGNYILLDYVPDKTAFSEAPENPVANERYYWALSEILNPNVQTTDGGDTGESSSGSGQSAGLPDELKWIYQLLSDKSWTYEDSNSSSVTIAPSLNDQNSVDLCESNFVNFNDFAGIYKSKPLDDDPKRCHYYAVRQVYDNHAVNGVVGTLHFINTRIGVISYEVEFDWNVGDALTRADGINNITLKITAPGLEPITRTITPNDIVQSDGKYFYYILNLPKYDTNGKLIPYEIEEVSINGESVGTNGEMTIGSDKCKVTVSDETIIEGAEAKTDDLHRIVITNTFEDTTSIEVHKKWVDNSNIENTRSDLYIKLHWISEKANSEVETSSKEYGWSKHADDSENYWTYTFSDLPKYDDEG